MAFKFRVEEDEIERMIAAANSKREALVIRLLFATGCRVSELVNVSKHDIDFTQGLMRVPHIKVKRVKECPNEACKRKNSLGYNVCPNCGTSLESVEAAKESETTHRYVKIDKTTLEHVKDYLNTRKRKREKRLIPLTRYGVYRIVRDTAQKAVGKGKILTHPTRNNPHYVSPHRLRDAHALRWLKHIRERGEDPGKLRELQQQLGHTQFSTTTSTGSSAQQRSVRLTMRFSAKKKRWL